MRIMNEQNTTLLLLTNRVENIQDGTGKNKSSINIYTNKNITELNELIYAGVKLVCEKIGVP